MNFDKIMKLFKEWRKGNLKEKLEAEVFGAFNFMTDQVYVVDEQNQESWKQEDFDQARSLIQYDKEKLEKIALKYRDSFGSFPVFYEDYLSKSKYVLNKLEEKARGKARGFIRGKRGYPSSETFERSHNKEFKQARNSFVNAFGNREHREANFCFAKDLNLIENIEKNKPKKLEKIEVRFRKESDEMFKLSYEINHGELKRMNYKELVDLGKRLDIKDSKLYDLAQRYSGLIGSETYVHPNFSKYLSCYQGVFDILISEIMSRNRELDEGFR